MTHKARTARKQPLVRYISPFGSPAWMTRERALKLLAEDDRHWEHLLRAEAEGAGKMLSDAQRQIGPPRIQRTGE